MERKWPTTYFPQELKRHPTALIYDDVAPWHIPAETVSTPGHPTQRNAW